MVIFLPPQCRKQMVKTKPSHYRTVGSNMYKQCPWSCTKQFPGKKKAISKQLAPGHRVDWWGNEEESDQERGFLLEAQLEFVWFCLAVTLDTLLSISKLQLSLSGKYVLCRSLWECKIKHGELSSILLTGPCKMGLQLRVAFILSSTMIQWLEGSKEPLALLPSPCYLTPQIPSYH